MEKFVNVIMAVFLVTGVLMIILAVGAGLYHVTHPQEVIKQRDKNCYEGCRASHDTRFCYQGCMVRK